MKKIPFLESFFHSNDALTKKRIISPELISFNFLLIVWIGLQFPFTVQAKPLTNNISPLIHELAESKAELEQCIESHAFQKLGKSELSYWITSINSNIERISNSMHDAPKGRLLFVTYNIAYTQSIQAMRKRSRRSTMLDQHRKINRDAAHAPPELTEICNKERFMHIETRVEAISSIVLKHIK